MERNNVVSSSFRKREDSLDWAIFDAYEADNEDLVLTLIQEKIDSEANYE